MVNSYVISQIIDHQNQSRTLQFKLVCRFSTIPAIWDHLLRNYLRYWCQHNTSADLPIDFHIKTRTPTQHTKLLVLHITANKQHQSQSTANNMPPKKDHMIQGIDRPGGITTRGKSKPFYRPSNMLPILKLHTIQPLWNMLVNITQSISAQSISAQYNPIPIQSQSIQYRPNTIDHSLPHQ